MNRFLEFNTEKKYWEKAVSIANSVMGENYGISGGSAGYLIEYLPDDFVMGKRWFLVDERKVSLEDDESNCKLIKKYNSEIELNCLWHDDNYVKSLPDKLDLVIMGVGPDGHIASLFDENDYLKKSVVVETSTDDFMVRERISLGMQYLLKSKKVLILMKGKPKFAIWNKMINLDKEKKEGLSPIEYFLNHFDGDLIGLYLNDYSKTSSSSSKP